MKYLTTVAGFSQYRFTVPARRRRRITDCLKRAGYTAQASGQILITNATCMAALAAAGVKLQDFA